MAMMSRGSASTWRRSAIVIALAVGAMAAGSPLHSAPAKPKPISFEISNKRCFRGPGLAPYIDQAIAKRKRAAQRDGGELGSFYVRVPNRPWNGLTVTAIALHYESTSVYFREPEAKVRQVLKRIGVRIDANGNMPIENEEAVEMQRLSATKPESRAYGASEINCGV